MNQNQRYEVRMDFKSTVFMPYGHEPGYECRMAFPEASTPQNRTYRTGVKCSFIFLVYHSFFEIMHSFGLKIVS